MSLPNPDLSGLSTATRAWAESGRWLDREGRRICVVERVRGPCILRLHGFPTSAYDWQGVIERLSDDHRVVALDFPGYGLSDKPDDYSYSLFQQADAVEAVARQLRIEAARVVSHDMGTSVHCELLARQNVRRLSFRITHSTLTNGSMLQWLAQITPFQHLLSTNSTLPEAMELCRTSMAEMYIPALRALMKRPEKLDEQMAAVMNELMPYQAGHLRLPALSGYMRERYVHRERWLGGLASAGAALQFVWADGDPIATVEMGRELKQMHREARYTELSNVGHFLIFEDPESVVREIRAAAA